MSLKSSVASLVSTSATTMYTCPAGMEASAHGVVFSNVTAADSTAQLFVYKASTNILTQVGVDIVVKSYKTLAWPRPINLQSGDYIQGQATVNSTIDLTVSSCPSV